MEEVESVLTAWFITWPQLMNSILAPTPILLYSPILLFDGGSVPMESNVQDTKATEYRVSKGRPEYESPFEGRT
jgi:hypothetical protein